MHRLSDKRQIYPVKNWPPLPYLPWQMLCILNHMIKIISFMKQITLFAIVLLLIVGISSCNSNESASSPTKSVDTASASTQSSAGDNYGNFTYDLAKHSAKWLLPN
jgi:hypothetical protein